MRLVVGHAGARGNRHGIHFQRGLGDFVFFITPLIKWVYGNYSHWSPSVLVMVLVLQYVLGLISKYPKRTVLDDAEIIDPAMVTSTPCGESVDE